MSLSKLLVNFLIEMVVIMGSILLTVLYYALVLPFFFILLLHREVVISFAKWIHPSWIPTSIVGSVLATDKLNQSKVRCVTGSFEVEKPFEVNKFRNRVEDYISRTQNHEQKSAFIRWMRIYFLKPVSNFEIDSIFKVNYSRDYQKVKTILENCYTPPFHENQPVWEITIFPCAKETKTILYMRFHHGLMDAMSCMRILQELADPNPEVDKQFQSSYSSIIKKYMPPLTWTRKLLIGLDLVLLTPFKFSYMGLKGINVNMWTIPRLFEGSGMITHYQRYDVAQIQQIARKLGTNATTLFSCALVGAFREEMMARGDSVENDITLGFVLPSPQHLHKQISNYLILTPAKFPISAKSMATRLLRMDEIFQELRRPAWILQCDLMTKFAGLVVALLGLKTMPKFFGSGGWTNISTFGFESEVKILGRRPTNVTLNSGMHAEGMPAIFCSCVFKDEIVLSVNTHEAIFSDGLEEFFNRIEYELEAYSGM